MEKLFILKKYRSTKEKILKGNIKIKKATRNVFAFRFKDEKNNNIVEDYDDDGEHYAGTRILGYLQKIIHIHLFFHYFLYYLCFLYYL